MLLHATIGWPLAAQTRVPLQPFAQQVRQVETSLAYLGQPLAPKDADAINHAIGHANEAAAIEQLEEILDRYALAIVDINAEGRVKVQGGLREARTGRRWDADLPSESHQQSWSNRSAHSGKSEFTSNFCAIGFQSGAAEENL